MRLARSLVSAAAVLAALAFAAPSLAETAELVVVPYDANRLGIANADTGIALVFPRSLPATQKAVVYVPAGYSVNLSQPVGTKLGTVSARLVAGAAGGAAVTATGSIVVDDPARSAADPRAQACAAGRHANVWRIDLTASGTAFSIPVYVDPTSGTDSAVGAFRLTICLASPDVPASAGGAALGARLFETFVEFTSGIGHPATRGEFMWRAFITPYVPGTAAANDSGTVEARSTVPLPQILKVKGRYEKKSGSAVLSGTFSVVGQLVSGVDVLVYGSPNASGKGLKRLASVKTKKKGVWSHKRKLARTTYFLGLVDEYFTGTCGATPSPAPGGCVQENFSFEAFAFAKVVKPKKK